MLMANVRCGGQSRAAIAAGCAALITAATAHPAQRLLAQAPLPPPAPQSRPLQPLSMTQLDERERAENLENGKTFSLTFAEPIPVRDLLLLLVHDTSISVVAEPDVTGTFIGELKNVTLRQALDLILQPLKLDCSIQGSSIRVFVRRTETRIFDINHAISRRIATRTAMAPSSVAGSGAQITASEESDVFAELSNGLRTLISAAGKFNLDRKAALLQVTDFPDRLERIALYLEAVQARVNRQVQIQAQVLEIELRDPYAAGLDWAAILKAAASGVSVSERSSSTTNGGFTLKVNIHNFNALVAAFGTQGTVNVLSSPQFLAMNNEPALMKVGTQDVFFVTTSQIDLSSGRPVQATVAPQSITEGVVLSVTPQVTADGLVTMRINPTVTERTGQAVSPAGDTVPVVTVREADTIVRVKQGETIVIAGMLQDRVTTELVKTRWNDVPLIGGLFRKEEKTRHKTDTVILLTPTVVLLERPAPSGPDAASHPPDRKKG
jgi:MSHA biogenesis protein MshL